MSRLRSPNLTDVPAAAVQGSPLTRARYDAACGTVSHDTSKWENPAPHTNPVGAVGGNDVKQNLLANA
ncbi:hypothetical protein [Candidatus Poriferisocius sp.]|uniref:hypothetical protein n=1 Tax=Candidatus Poriferisocius sp. TaxID=3101276 RepID=UPI003B5C051C